MSSLWAMYSGREQNKLFLKIKSDVFHLYFSEYKLM